MRGQWRKAYSFGNVAAFIEQYQSRITYFLQVIKPSASRAALKLCPLPLLQETRQRFTQSDLAARLSVTPKTIARWDKGETPCPHMLEPAECGNNTFIRKKRNLKA